MSAAPARCVECARFTLRRNRTMAKLAMGNCALKPAWTFVSTDAAACARSAAAEPEAVARRIEWLSASTARRGST